MICEQDNELGRRWQVGCQGQARGKGQQQQPLAAWIPGSLLEARPFPAPLTPAPCPLSPPRRQQAGSSPLPAEARPACPHVSPNPTTA